MFFLIDTGGEFNKPTYKDVCSHKTGHAEAIEIVFDPSQVSYDELLEVLWTIHDPTTLNRQGPDVGCYILSGFRAKGKSTKI